MINSTVDIKSGVLMRYNEVALKGLNRGWFEKKLAQNACRMLKRDLKLEDVPFKRTHGRIILTAPWSSKTETSLKKVFGATGFSPIKIVPTKEKVITEVALAEFRKQIKIHGRPSSFRVSTRRSDKAIPKKSNELNRDLGALILDEHTGLKVDLTKPDLTLGIEVRNESSYIWTHRIRGPGGLPTGTNARVLVLLSGGLDSPVAALKIMRRGSPVHFVHFYGTPFVGQEVLNKVEDLARKINEFSAQSQSLTIVPFGKIQETMALATHPKLRTILYRRMMYRIASKLLPVLDAKAIVTGESLGQVASQTVENISTVNQVLDVPVLQPLIGMDKEEIISCARDWGTFDISVQPGMDCCSLFADRHPAIRSSLDTVLAEEENLDIDSLVNQGLEARFKLKL